MLRNIVKCYEQRILRRRAARGGRWRSQVSPKPIANLEVRAIKGDKGCSNAGNRSILFIDKNL